MESKDDQKDTASGSNNLEMSKEKPGSSEVSHEDDGTVELIRRYLAEKLGFYSEETDEKTNKPKVLDDVSVDGIATLIKEGKCKNIVTMAGAGISTSAGIPDFRSPGSGLYHNLQKYNLPNPQAIFEIGFFRKNPQPFFTLAKELYPGSFKPTICHYFVKLLNQKGVLLRHYTQNIDTLERVAGLPGDKIIEAHGTFFTSHCLECNKEYSLEWMKDRIFQDVVPTCDSCNGIVKPDIVFFGECLPSDFYEKSTTDFPKADLLIVMGSSLAVQPFASLVDKVRHQCPRLLINREKVGHRDRLMMMLGMGSGMDFDSETNSRDVLWLGDCDENIDTLERVAGLPGDKIIEAHGTFFTSHCLECNKEYSLEWMKDRIFQDVVPTCDSCNGIVKPDIVFFGECLPSDFYEKSTTDFPKADLLIVMGSSLAVQPFASLVDKVRHQCPRLLINREKVGHRDRLMMMLGMGSGMDFDSETNSRDVLWLGDCDEGCQVLADKIGWGEELKALVKEEHKKIDDEKAKEKNAVDNIKSKNSPEPEPIKKEDTS